MDCDGSSGEWLGKGAQTTAFVRQVELALPARCLVGVKNQAMVRQRAEEGRVQGKGACLDSNVS